MLFYAKQNARVAIVTMAALLIISNLWAAARGIALSDTVHFSPAALALAWISALLVLSIDGLIYFVNWCIGFRPFLNAFDRAITQLFGRATVPSALAAGLLAALGEETFFRGIVQAELGLVPAALLFALLHGGRGFNLLALWAVLEGLLLGWLYQLSGNLLLPMIAHGVHDTCGILFARYLYKRLLPPAPTLFDWLVKLAKR